jgi:hypothetical protein
MMVVKWWVRLFVGDSDVGIASRVVFFTGGDVGKVAGAVGAGQGSAWSSDAC